MLALSARVKPTTNTGKSRPRWEVADALYRGAAAYRRTHSLTSQQLKVMHAIETCRTPALGGHLDRCKKCGFERPAFNSCRNRHCPKCQTLRKQRWLEDRKAELLPVPYFHQVFTLPHELNTLVLYNKRVLLNVLFRATSETLQAFGRRKFGGQIGFTLILHTWDQRMHAHSHLHCVIPAGGLYADQTSWSHADPEFLFPVRALSRVFRAKFLSLLDRTFEQEELYLPRNLAQLATARARIGFFRQLARKDWVVYSKRPFAGPEQVLEYLGRYTHRVAISNDRIIDVGDENVRFRYRKRSDPDCPVHIETVDTHEFIRRFLLHVLPTGFMRIRHYGFLANSCKRERLATCRRLLGVPNIEASCPDDPPAIEELILQLTGVDISRCPQCGATLVRQRLPRQIHWRPETPALDSS